MNSPSEQVGRVARPACCRDQRGEVFPVAILFGGVLLTILIGLHVVLVSVARTAVQAAADRGVTAAQAARIGEGDCGSFDTGDRAGKPKPERVCEGEITTLAALNASTSMVRRTRSPDIYVKHEAGVVSVTAFGAVISPVFGQIEVVGVACGPLDLVDPAKGGGPSRADLSAC